MTIDKIENLEKYIPEKYREKVSQYMKTVTSKIPEGTYEIEGQYVFARVMSYSTKPDSKCRIEAHNQYIDIQMTLIGAEGITLYERSKLELVEKRETEDVEFFKEDKRYKYASNHNIPGFFTMIFPEEAHRPQEMIEGFDAYVKKIVIKIKT